MTAQVPEITGRLEALHEFCVELFAREAAIMRGYAYWVPCVSRLEDKLLASHLVYLHMKNADDVRRLIDMLRVPLPGEVYSRATRHLTVAMQSYQSFAELRATMVGSEVLAHRARIREIAGSSPRLFDYYALETLRGIERRYEDEILPALAGEAGV